MLASSEGAQMIDRNVPTNLVMCIGNAGTGVGSRIRGHVRRGGKKMLTEHSRNTTVAITNEFCSSKTCVFCFQQTELAKRRLPGGKTKQVSGAVRCINPNCPAVPEGTQHGIVISKLLSPLVWQVRSDCFHKITSLCRNSIHGPKAMTMCYSK
ncbi:uncharacterized protein BYT42DRAFT_29730 [Radiomyces spectabilis]|uniref:uncharacterized protein n=1 Tax=Radiomyces spectabilis TaxID=64574 RepID=UPI00221E5E03|nr:uncharacterized protein BYT42DRAFT_29730 [Radiomyces spectabilis]KAI8394078.1 hypothetical protein BYT42DRAFT_29730 [Radiomyces spectabilis]